MPDYPPTAGISNHGTSKHDATVMKKTAFFILLHAKSDVASSSTITYYRVVFNKAWFDKILSIKFGAFAWCDGGTTSKLTLFDVTSFQAVISLTLPTSAPTDPLLSSDCKASLPSSQVTLAIKTEPEDTYAITYYNVFVVVELSE